MSHSRQGHIDKSIHNVGPCVNSTVYCCDDHHDQEQLGEECFISSHMPPPREVRARTQGINLEAATEAETIEELFLGNLIEAFSLLTFLFPDDLGLCQFEKNKLSYKIFLVTVKMEKAHRWQKLCYSNQYIFHISHNTYQQTISRIDFCN